MRRPEKQLTGVPVVLRYPESPVAVAFRDVTDRMLLF